MPKESPFQVVIDALLNAAVPFPARYLRFFSDIEPASLKLLASAWSSISLERKSALLEDLQDLNESDTLTNFHDLARAFLDDADAPVRTAAIRLLGECEDKHLVPGFMRSLQEDESAAVRAAAASALGMFVLLGELEEIPADLKASLEAALQDALKNDKSEPVRLRALEALGASSSEEVNGLIESAFQRNGSGWKASALTAMGRSSDERWEKHILSQLTSPVEEIRSAAAQAAGEVGLPSARTALLGLLEDEDIAVRHAAVRALSCIGGEGVRQRLEEMMDAEADDEEAEIIEDALGNLLLADELDAFDMLDVDPDVELHEEADDPLE